jgi:protein CpxP
MTAILDEKGKTMFLPTISLTRTLAAATFLGTVALAGSGYAQMATPVASEDTAKTARPDHIEKRISNLHDKLHITAAQETQWTAVAQTMRDNAESMDALIKDRSANTGAMTAMDSLHSYQKLAEAHEDGLKKFIPAFQSLYDNMSADQQKAADAAFRTHGSHEKHNHNKV